MDGDHAKQKARDTNIISQCLMSERPSKKVAWSTTSTHTPLSLSPYKPCLCCL